MKFNLNQCYHGFKLIDEKVIEEVEGVGRVFKHEKSGAKLIHIENDDTNKVFTMTFKTPPSDNTGVAHIVEHAVCCASKKYPLKDTFIEMDKGSLNTALNACTYKDMTMYYCASQNEKDLLNLMEVYMDLVFNPLMFERKLIFKQEGWHYALENIEDEITYNGIVYNEMKGEYAEPSTLLEHELHKALFPDTVYQFDSGGVPENIVDLSEDDFERFYYEYYQTQNLTLYLYGDGELMRQLELIDSQYLSHKNKGIDVPQIDLQPVLDSPQEVYMTYPVREGQDLSDKYLMAISFVVGEVVDSKLRLAFQILEHMLLKSAASPVAEALISKAGLGKVLEETGYDPGKQQPTFSFVLSGAKANTLKQFENQLFEVLRQMVQEGIERSFLEASIHTVMFGLKEGESQVEPKGVLYSEDVQMSMLYGGEPFAHLTFQKDLEAIEKEAKAGYFEAIIEKYFLNNTHHAKIVLVPDSSITVSKEALLTKKLYDYKKSLKKRELKALIKMNEILDQFQEEPNTPEDLSLLPMLQKSDLRREVEPISLKVQDLDEARIVWQEQQCGDVVYLHLLFDAAHIKKENIPYLGLLANLLTYIGTEHYTYQELENAINGETGGINCSINAYSHCLDTDSYAPYFKISGKVLVNRLPKLTKLLEEIILLTHFRDKEKIKEIIDYVHYEMERSFTGAPEYRCTRRLYTYLSESAIYEDQVSGIDYYEMISELIKEFDESYSSLAKTLETIYQDLMVQNGLRVYVTADPRHMNVVEQDIKGFVSTLRQADSNKCLYMFESTITNEGYITANEVQAIAKGYNFKKSGLEYDGGLHVAANLINSTYLWDKVRLQGGAYGCELALGRDGNLILCSYCDPELIGTLDVFDEIGDFLRNIQIEERELMKYMIGTIGAIDYPMTMEQKSERAIAYDLCGLTQELLQEERNQILDVTIEKLKSYATIFEGIKEQGHICVIGSKEMIERQKELFCKIREI